MVSRNGCMTIARATNKTAITSILILKAADIINSYNIKINRININISRHNNNNNNNIWSDHPRMNKHCDRNAGPESYALCTEIAICFHLIKYRGGWLCKKKSKRRQYYPSGRGKISYKFASNHSLKQARPSAEIWVA